MRRHLIIASYDGVVTHYCGVGTIVRNTILSLKKSAYIENLKVSLAYVSADQNGKIFNTKCFKDSAELVRKTGGHLIPLCNGTAGFDEADMWKSFPEWEYECASLATSLNMVLDSKDNNILMLHDTPFLLFSKFKQQFFGKSLRCYYLPHSSGLNHAFGNNEWRRRRVALERDSFKLIKCDKNSYLLATGRNFAKHLIENYDVTFTDSDYLVNGLYFDRYKESMGKRFINSNLKQFGIDIGNNSKIIFSWGRCSIAKGLKELIEAWGDIVEKLPNHYLIIQAPNNSGEDSYHSLLERYSKKIPRTILINDFNPKIWQSILRTESTDVVCIPSLMDPNPHTAIEAKLFSIGMNYVIIGSNIDGIKDTYTDNECFWINPYNRKEFSGSILKAVNLSRDDRRAMSKSNNKSLSNYDYSKNLKNFLENIKFI